MTLVQRLCYIKGISPGTFPIQQIRVYKPSRSLRDPLKMADELRQFRCLTCPGKYQRHQYRLWYKRVCSAYPKSQCNVCKKMIDAVPRGEEEGVHICNFSCPCGHTYGVRCKMQNTAPCYSCRSRGKEVWLRPHSFLGLRWIHRMTDNVHECDECYGNGDCPNMH